MNKEIKTMKRNRWGLKIATVALAAAMVVTGCAPAEAGRMIGAPGGGAPVSETAAVQMPALAETLTPEAVVGAYYGWYVDYVRTQGNPLVDKAYHGRPELTEAFVADVDAIIAGFDKGGYDPFLCAQDAPDSFEVSVVRFEGDEAVVTMNTSFEGHQFDVRLVQTEAGWKIDDVLCDLGEATSLAPQEPVVMAGEAVTLPELGIALQAPAGWAQLEPEMAWQLPGSERGRVGIAWVKLEPPMELEAALLPTPSETYTADTLETPLGQARRFFLAVFEGEAKEGERAPVVGEEIHILLTVEREGARYGEDLYASSNMGQELALELEPALLALAQSFSAAQ
jgi:hypothetical protein